MLLLENIKQMSMTQQCCLIEQPDDFDGWSELASSWVSHGPVELPQYLGEEGSLSKT